MAYSGVPALHATYATFALLPRGGGESGTHHHGFGTGHC
jgi:hypothetical protein